MITQKTRNDMLFFLENIKNFKDFDEKLSKETNEIKGLYFEIFCKLYFILIPYYFDKIHKIYLYNEISQRKKEKLKLPIQDKGIDLIAILKNKKIISIQAKYRSDKKKLSFSDLSTFLALTYGTECNFHSAILFTNCYDVCDELKNEKYILITNNSFDKCDNIFWQNARKYLCNEKQNYINRLEPLPFQYKILNLMYEYYKNNNYGKLYLPCGTGKTFLGCWFTIEMLKCSKILITVPSLYLLSDTFETWSKQIANSYNYEFLLIGSDIDKSKKYLCEYEITTNKNIIKKKLKNNNKNIIVITTYQSSPIIKKICKKIKYVFDICIFDEAHRTVGSDDKCFSTLVLYKKISNKRLFMTATKRVIDKNDKKKVLSMNDKEYYGETIEKYTLRNAIDNGQLVDYNIIAPFISLRKISDEIANSHKIYIIANLVINLFLEGKIKHLLLFSNRNKNANEIIAKINLILEKEKKIKIFTKYLDGECSMSTRKKYVELFEKSEYGIISSSRIFGEGVNIPICDSVCFVDNRSSSIDIVQNVGRCLRKYDKNPNKISNVIIPFILRSRKDNNENFFDNMGDRQYKKIKSILKILSKEDAIVSEKIFLHECKTLYENGEKEFVDENEYYDIDVHKFRKNIITKIFDKCGNPISRARKILMYINKKRNENNEKLIITRNKCLEFLKKRDIEIDEHKERNWIEFALGDKMFGEFKNKYYCDVDEIRNAILKIKISSYEEYKEKYYLDNKLIPTKYINSGFFIGVIDNFNFNMVLKKYNNQHEIE